MTFTRSRPGETAMGKAHIPRLPLFFAVKTGETYVFVCSELKATLFVGVTAHRGCLGTVCSSGFGTRWLRKPS